METETAVCKGCSQPFIREVRPSYSLRQYCTKSCQNTARFRRHREADKERGSLGALVASGQRYGRLVVKERIATGDSGHAFWLCSCDCGSAFTAQAHKLHDGRQRSCGCKQKEILAANREKRQIELADYKAKKQLEIEESKKQLVIERAEKTKLREEKQKIALEFRAVVNPRETLRALKNRIRFDDIEKGDKDKDRFSSLLANLIEREPNFVRDAWSTDPIFSFMFYKELTRDNECHYCRGDLRSSRQAYCLDRLDFNLPHRASNVVPCCWECNRLRGNVFSYEEMMELSSVLREIRKRRSSRMMLNQHTVKWTREDLSVSRNRIIPELMKSPLRPRLAVRKVDIPTQQANGNTTQQANSNTRPAPQTALPAI